MTSATSIPANLAISELLGNLDQRLVLKLSAMEWLVVLMAVSQEVTPSMARSIDPNLSEEALRGALLAARDALIARDFARKDAEGKLELNPLMLLCVRGLAEANKSVALTLFDGPHPSTLIRYGITDGIAIGSWSDADQMQWFELIEPALLAESVYSHWHARHPDLVSSDSTATVVASAAMPDMRASTKLDQPQMASALSRAGVPEPDAIGIAHALGEPRLRATLVTAFSTPDLPIGQSAQSLIWLSNGEAIWLIEENPEPLAESVMVRRVSAQTLRDVVASFVRAMAVQ